MKQHSLPLLTVVGTTASGKSDLAVTLALRYSGEVISADSRQINRHLNQTTGKIMTEEMKGVSHHMLDIIDPGEMYSAHQFADEAVPLVEDIYTRGKVPILAGGTGFYIDAVLFEGVTARVPADPLFRERKAASSLSDLQKELQTKDSAAYKRIDVKNPRRLIRALEIIRATGIFPLQQRTKRYEYHAIGIKHSRPHLRERIIQRLNERFEGMTEEIQQLLNREVEKAWFERMGLECRHIARMLTEHISEKKTKEHLAKAIFAYAKRQETWLRRYPEIVWYQEHQCDQIYHDLDALYK